MLRKLFTKIIRLVLILWALQIVYTIALNWINPPITPNMLVSIYHNIGEANGFKHKNIAYQEMGQNIKWAVIASEDQKFADHYGFDLASIKSSVSGEGQQRIRGASTISQQTAKNLFLVNTRSWFRKGLEAIFTLELELFLPKSLILKHYLNICEFGPNIYGIQAASEYYFEKKAIDLSKREADFLASILPSPIKRGRMGINAASKKINWIERQKPALKQNSKLNKLIEGD